MWWSYEDAQERKEDVQRLMDRRRSRGEVFELLEVKASSKKLCSTFWGQAWCRHLEAFQVYEGRLQRGRSYLRQKTVYNLKIKPGVVEAIVAGATLYETRVHIRPLAEHRWADIAREGSGQVHSMLDLLAGRLGDGLMQLLVDVDRGLFPSPGEMRFDCSCPDHADLCKHVAAVLYGTGVLLDERPELLFTLRGVDQAELLSVASSVTAAGLSSVDEALSGSDLSRIFGIELGEMNLPSPSSDEKSNDPSPRSSGNT